MSEENTTPQETVETTVDLEATDVRSYTEDEVQSLLKALKAERESAKIYKKDLKEKQAQLERFASINPDEYLKLQEEAAMAARERAAVEERSALLEEKYGSQAAEAVKQRDQSIRELQEFQKRYALEKVFFAAGGRTDSEGGVSFFEMLADRLGNRFRLESSGDIIVVDDQGDPMMDKETGKRVDPETFLATYKNHRIYGTFFKGAKGSGAGLGYGGTDASGIPTEDLGQLSAEELFQRAFG